MIQTIIMPQSHEFCSTLDLMQSHIEQNLNICDSHIFPTSPQESFSRHLSSPLTSSSNHTESTPQLSSHRTSYQWNDRSPCESPENVATPYLCRKYLSFSDESSRSSHRLYSPPPITSPPTTPTTRWRARTRLPQRENVSGRSPNVNPLMVASRVVTARKRRWDSDDNGGNEEDVHSLVTLLDNSPQTLFKTDECRFVKDFEVEKQLGSGSFGCVYLVRHRLDGAQYAVKQCKQRQYTGTRNTSCLREVWALSCITHHDNIVRYYCSWAERDHLYIQLEYCNAGTLAKLISSGHVLGEMDMKCVLLDMAKALDYIHHLGIVHLDVKPDNILMHSDDDSGGKFPLSSHLLDINANSSDDKFAHITFKLGDFGLATTSHPDLSPRCLPSVEDGDRYYLPRELLTDDYHLLPRADVFSLSLSVYEGCEGGREVVRGDEYWELIHMRGELPALPSVSSALNNMLKNMVNPDPSLRPSPHDILISDVMEGVRGSSNTSSSSLHNLLQAKERAEKENVELKQRLVEMEHKLVMYQQQTQSDLGLDMKRCRYSKSPLTLPTNISKTS